ncbi:TPA: hypothetical protein N0F65_001593 [Lagenidium giganteum]|uniref:RING-type domain-containing protein n=1 Tax=Lagenidium giganteum TaxID=4803 RepID=A0AAV2Z710_9STRA|nr:TPA: hypothetical protein N0F65_001593 [Lagenidium giganteum]
MLSMHAHHQHSHSLRRSSTGSRKRPLTSAPTSNHSQTGALPSTIAPLSNVVLEVAVAKQSRTDVKYVLAVHHAQSNTKWQHTRLFEEYRRFQQRVLHALDHGHFCTAECPWLYSFITSYFPKKHMFRMAHSSCVVSERVEGLAQFLNALQTFVLDNGNHSCSVIVNRVGRELVSFVYGDVVVETPVEAMGAGSFSKCRSNSLSSTDEEDNQSTCSSSCASVCLLCDSDLDSEAHSGRHSLEDTTSTSTNSSAPRSSYAYTTTLGCGHQFHDECIVPKLNESMSCPVCGHHETQ